MELNLRQMIKLSISLGCALKESKVWLPTFFCIELIFMESEMYI